MAQSSNHFLGCIAIISAVICCTPILERAVLLAFASFLMMSFIVRNIGTKDFSRSSSLQVSVGLFVMLMLLYHIVGVSDTSLVSYTVFFAFFLTVSLMPFMPRLAASKGIKRVLVVMVAVMLLNIIDNIYLCIRYPEINLASTRDFMSEETLAGLNVGSTRFYTFTLFFFDVCFFVFLNCREKKTKWLMLLCSVITAVYICMYCLKATVVVFFILSIFFLLYAKRRKQSTSLLITLALTSVLVSIVIVNYTEEIINFIVSVSPSERLTVRLVTLIDADSAEASSVTLTNRTDLYMLSVKTWLSSPVSFLFGIGDHSSNFDVASTGIGHHSDFLDSLARYGLLGSILIGLFLLKSFKLIVGQFDKRYRFQLYAIFFIFILCGVTKAIFLPGVGCVIYILLPLTAPVINNQNTTNCNK